jgi:hypothetical protein
MIQILCGSDDHRVRCNALVAATPGSSLASASGPAERKVMRIDTLTFWGHGDASHFCGLTATAFVDKVKEWMNRNPTIKTLEIIACNSRHGTTYSKPRNNGTAELSWVKSYTDQVKPRLKKLGLTVKALPMGIGPSGANRWSVLVWSATTNTWLYITAGGAKDDDFMWPAVVNVQEEPLFKNTKNFVSAGTVVKARATGRQYTIDFGTIGQLRSFLTTLV